MSLASFEAALPAGDRVLLDSSVLIAYLDGGEANSPVATHLLDVWVRGGRNEALVSTASVVEVLVRPIRAGPPEGYRHTLDFLRHHPHLRLVDVDLDVAHEAAVLRARFELKAADALIVASSLVHQVGHLATSDHAWSARLQPLQARVPVLDLSRHRPLHPTPRP